MKKILAIGFILAAITVASCKKSETAPEPTPIPEPTHVTKGFDVYLCEITNSNFFPTNIYFRTSSNGQLVDSTSSGSKNILNSVPGDICTAGSASGNVANLKVLNNSAYKLEVCCIMNSTVTVLGYFNYNSDGSKTGAGPTLSPQGSTGYFSSVACERQVVKM